MPGWGWHVKCATFILSWYAMWEIRYYKIIIILLWNHYFTFVGLHTQNAISPLQHFRLFLPATQAPSTVLNLVTIWFTIFLCIFIHMERHNLPLPFHFYTLWHMLARAVFSHVLSSTNFPELSESISLQHLLSTINLLTLTSCLPCGEKGLSWKGEKFSINIYWRPCSTFCRVLQSLPVFKIGRFYLGTSIKRPHHQYLAFCHGNTVALPWRSLLCWTIFY